MTGTNAAALHLGFSYIDRRGNMTGLTNYLDRAKDKTFDYDNLSRLRIHSGAWGNGSFTYYSDGNRWLKTRNGTTTYSYHLNRLNLAAGTSYGYDLAGNMTSAGNFSYAHTPFDRMNQIKENNTVILTSGFDGNGNRVYKTANSKTTLYLRDFSGRVLSEMDSSGTFYDDYIYLGSTLVAKDNVPDPNGDSDNDGLTYAEEITHGTDPYNPDSDGDTVLDGLEVQNGTDPLDADSDDDGLSDGEETQLGTDPLNPDTDGDGIPDGIDPYPLVPATSDTGWLIPAVYLPLLLNGE